MSGPLVLAPSLVDDLRAVGVRAGDVVEVHASLRSLGWVCGGARAVVAALRAAVGPQGTVVVATQTTENSDPSGWENPPVPEEWWPAIREHLPPYDPGRSPSQGIGAVAEALRTDPDAWRSDHPQTSFAAVGAHAEEVVGGHELTSGLGERSPLARLEALDARVLLLGADYAACTALHLAEYRVPAPRVGEHACAVRRDGVRMWVTYEDVIVDEEDFAELGAAFETQTGRVRVGSVGAAESRLFAVRDAVGFAVSWMTSNRSLPGTSV